MSTKIAKPLTLALGTAFIGTLSLAQMASADTAFQLNQLATGYMATGFGEGKCGMDKMDTNKDGSVSKAEFDAAKGQHFDKLDTDKNGSLSKAELEAGHKGKEGKCGEGKCGGDAKGKEGSCGGDKDKKGKEGSCGGHQS